MSEGVLIAIIGVIGTVIGATISGIFQHPHATTINRSWLITFAIVGMFAGLVVGVFITQQKTPLPEPNPLYPSQISAQIPPTTVPTIPPTIVPTIPPTIVPIIIPPTDTPLPVVIPPTAIPTLIEPLSSQALERTVTRNEVSQWTKTGQVSREEVLDCLGQIHAGPRPFFSIHKGDTIPSSSLVVSNFSLGGKEWTDLPVTPICRLGSWGLFESTQTFQAPYEGAYWIITP